MDLPKSRLYGVRCPHCTCTLWYDSESKASLACLISFQDKGLPLIREAVGIVIGFSNFKHHCVPELKNDDDII